ncbi:dephospho-CoA kinase [Chloroflexota bacterium]
MKVIGLTGGIGSGKTTVSRFLAALGAAVIDADVVGHEAFLPGTKLHQQVVDTFGAEILAPGGNIDRAKLGEMVFGQPEKLAALNELTHPAILNMVQSKINGYKKAGFKAVVLEVPLLVEAGWQDLADEIWVTVAPEDVIIKRLCERSGLTEAQARARINVQLNEKERNRAADRIINTSRPLSDLGAAVKDLW